jgi:outer membrane protein TolC
MNLRILSILVATFAAVSGMMAGNPIKLTLDDAIRMANDSSLTAFRYQNLMASGYWEWRNYKAERLPGLSLSSTPVSYNRYITQRYDSQQDIDVYRAQQLYSASAGLTVSQNVDFLGGALYLESDLNYIRNFGAYKSNQFSAIPMRIGYRQSLLGYNQFKWDKAIEPLKYEKVRRQFVYNMECVSENVVNYFFALALAQTELKLAVDNLATSDSLYIIGERRFAIASISRADLLTLKLDLVNAGNTLANARISLRRAQFALATFLGIDTDTNIDVEVPGTPRAFKVPADKALEMAHMHSPTLLEKQQAVLEAKRDLNKAVVESRFSASINASVGFNQVANTFGAAYENLMRQDLVSVSLTIPLVDWGVRKGKCNIARNALNVAEISAQQEKLSIEQEILIAIDDFEMQQGLVASAIEAMDLADMAYAQTRQRFIIGNADINSLTLSHSRQQDAAKNYITAMQNYWLSYYKIRKLTLYDFEFDMDIPTMFDNIQGIR